ncbi:6-phosphofructo-2-kinase, partial [Ascoidea rubescens DSM 1968]
SNSNSKYLIILVGLPACGKSTFGKRLKQDLEKNANLNVGIFNAGNVRRNFLNSSNVNQNANYFDFNNSETSNQREFFAKIALDNCLSSLIFNQIDIGLLDATNSTFKRRNNLFNSIQSKLALFPSLRKNLNVLLIDIKTSSLKNWKFNIELKLTSSPDYLNNNINHKDALIDFIKRTKNYLSAFQPVEPTEIKKYNWNYILIDNSGDSYY